MVFSSVTFLVFFLPLTMAAYYLFRPGTAARNTVLLAASLLFYAWGEPRFVLVMLLSIGINWAAGLIVHRSSGERKLRRAIIAAMLTVNLGIIFFWKYAGFTVTLANRLTGTAFPVPVIALPIGISFFTLQGISYVLDIFMKGLAPLRSPADVGLYIAFFPQLIAGPIVRYETIAPQIYDRHEGCR